MYSIKNALADLRVLMYHRVARPGLDPWKLCVSPGRFARQLEALRNRFEIISLAEVPQRDDFRNTVALTFDDGYSDNLLMAKPILEEFSAPATVFVTTAYLTAGREFWWDELEQIFLVPGILPKVLDLSIGGLGFRYEFQGSVSFSEDQANSHVGWKVTWDGSRPPTERHELFLAVWNLLVDLKHNLRTNVIEFLFDWSGVKRIVRHTHKPLDAQGLLALSKGGLIRIGSHTVTHPDLTALPAEEKTIELNQSKRDLETLLNTKVETIAYPHGRYDQETQIFTREAGYQMAFGAGKPENSDSDQMFRLTRKMILDQDVDRFIARIQ